MNINYKMRLLIFLVFSQYGVACRYGIISQISLDTELHFLTPGVAVANQARL